MTSGKVLQGEPLGGEIESVDGHWLNCVKLKLSQRMNGYFGNLTFLPEKNLLQNFKLFKKSFPPTKDLDFAYSGLRHDFEMLSRIVFCLPFLFVLVQLHIFFLLDLFWENIYDRVKSNFENIGSSDLLFKVSVFVLRCIFGYYSHRSRKLARNLTIGQYFPIVAFQNPEKDKFEVRFY